MRKLSSIIEPNDDGTAWVHLSRGYKALIDQSDIPIVAPYRWHVFPSRKVLYARRSGPISGGKRKGVLMHKELLGETLPPGLSIDHIDRDGLNNRRQNLRVVNNTIQKLNQSVRTDSTSGTPGVHMRPWGDWQARISVGNKRFSLGHFKTYADAKQCRDAVTEIVDYMLTVIAPSLAAKEENKL